MASSLEFHPDPPYSEQRGKAEELKEGIIVAIFGDHGFKYLSAGLFT
jgi:hypothetical protein